MTKPKGQDLSSQLHFAMYLPAISPGYGEIAIAPAQKYRPMPNGLEPSDLNFLDPQSKLFYLPAALYSAGIVADLSNPAETMVSKRDKYSSHVLADSGGYQIISGKLKITGSWQRKQIFDWQQSHCDAGMSLDVPTKALGEEASGYVTFEECLSDTLEHLQDYQYFYQASKFPLLNVIQGRTAAEADAWYAMASGFKFDGWAFAGDLKEDLYQVIRRCPPSGPMAQN